MTEPQPEALAPKRRKSAVEQARDLSIRAMLKKGMSQRQVAGVLGMARETVRNVSTRAKAQGEEYPDPRTIQRDKLALAVLDRCMAVGAKMPAKRVRASDAVHAVRTYAGIAWPAELAPAGPSISFTEIHIHEALIAPGQDTISCVDVSPEPQGMIDTQSNQMLAGEDSVA